MSRPKRNQRPNSEPWELEDIDAEEELQPASKRRASRGDEDEEDYAPGGNDDEEEEDHQILEEPEEDDDDDDQPGPSKGRKKNQLKGLPAKKNTNNKNRPRVRTQQIEIQDGDGPINVSRASIQKSQNLIIKYNNDAEQLCQEASNRGGGPTRQGIDALVRVVVRHIIFSNTEKPGVPIPRSEITRLVADNSAGFAKRAGLPSLIIAIAQAKLAECFGMEMVELTKPRGNSKDRVTGAAGGEGTKHFVLRSIVPPELYCAAVARRTSAASNGFLGVILSIIDMSGGSIKDEDLWKHLNDLGVHRAVEHPQLGIPRDLMEEFIKKRQIHAERVTGGEGVEVHYSIAENAMNEVGEAALKSFYEAACA